MSPGDLLQEYYTNLSSIISSSSQSSPSIAFCMTSIVLTVFLCWLVGILCLTSSASGKSSNNKNSNSNKSYSSVEAFRNVVQRRIVHIQTPIQSIIHSATKSVPASSTSLFLSSAETAYRDLAPPFNIMDDNNTNATPEDISNVVPGSNVTHFCFLIHGHRGLSRDLAYLQAVMQRWASEELRRQKGDTKDVKTDDNTSDSKETIKRKHDMVVHNAICNEGKTQDGVENGGDRLVEEMRQVIDMEMKKRHPEIPDARGAIDDSSVGDENEAGAINTEDSQKNNSAVSTEEPKIYDITISILGNSLGGLFGRYAIAKLVERYCVKEDDDSAEGKPSSAPCWILDGKYRLHLNIFCSTATPHLGVSGHTWVRIPRTAEIGVAHALGQSGKDLFRLNDLLHTMATSPTFLKPLGAFRKRIAYANCYGTDFAVPPGTAAFLSENSTYPHKFADDFIMDENGMVIAALHTPTYEGGLNEELEEHSDELHEMSASLDKLGWKKVFVDIRKEMPSVELPMSLRSLRQSSEPKGGDSGSNHSSRSESSIGSAEENIQDFQALKKQKVVSSRDLASAVTTPEDNRVALPLGHNMIVAFSRSRLSTFLNKGGRPVVDALAKELVADIFSWDGTTVEASPFTTDVDTATSKTPNSEGIPNLLPTPTNAPLKQ